MTRERHVTLATLARMLGVSRATVSNAYNRPDQLSPQLRERILTVARELNYPGPDPTGRALSRGRSGVIGVVFTEALAFAFSDPASVLVLQGLARVCEHSGVGLLLLPVAPGRGPDVAAVRDAAVDGIVIYSMPEDDPLVRAAIERKLPTVLIDQPDIDGVPFVGIDDKMAARQAADYLLELGHKRIAVVAYRLAPEPVDGPISPERVAAAARRRAGARLPGYREAIEAAGLTWDDIQIHERSANTPDAGYEAGMALLDQEPPPTALITDSDQLSLGVLRAARELGIAVPEQLSVLGFDDIPAAATSVPPLTTIRQPLLDKGFLAGRLLTDPPEAASARRSLDRLVLSTELVIRGSTAPPLRD